MKVVTTRPLPQFEETILNLIILHVHNASRNNADSVELLHTKQSSMIKGFFKISQEFPLPIYFDRRSLAGSDGVGKGRKLVTVWYESRKSRIAHGERGKS